MPLEHFFKKINNIIKWYHFSVFENWQTGYMPKNYFQKMDWLAKNKNFGQ